MATVEDITKAKRALTKASEDGRISDLMGVMDRLAKVKATQDLLKKTDIGKVLGKLRTHSDVAVSRRAKEIVKKWKDDVMSTPQPKAPAKVDPQPTPKSDSATPSAASSIASSPTTPSDAPVVARTVKGDEMRVKPTGNTPRDKTIEMVYAAIGLGSFADSDLLMKRAEKIELTLFEEYGGVTDGYKNKVRSLILNLKNKRNPGLRESVVSGELSIKELCTMSIEDMASEEKKAQDRKLAEEALFNARGAGSAQAETDMFMCGKCKGRKTTYFQMQTRSADEPMTTFVTCVLCGNRWKFC
ncbi:transcription elongation factor S-II [Umbelopsis sp. AD052]|nr:transcription elongation factor S-II [Umbelopsis sp. AD052]